MGFAEDIEQAYPQTRGGLARKIVEVAEQVGAHPYDLANLINWESGRTFDPRVQSGKGVTTFIPDGEKPGPAVGLIQFIASTAKGLGTSRAALYRMSAVQQMDYVRQYLVNVSKGKHPVWYPGQGYFASPKGPLATTQSLFMSVFYPPFMFTSSDAQFPLHVQMVNRGVRTPRDYLRKAMGAAKLPGSTVDKLGNPITAPPNVLLILGAASGFALLTMVGTLAFLDSYGRK